MKFNEILEVGKKIGEDLAKNVNELGKSIAKDSKEFYDKTSEQVKNNMKSKDKKIQELKEAASNLSPEEFQRRFKKEFNVTSKEQPDSEELEELRDYYSTELGNALKDTKSFSDSDKERLFYLIGEYKTEYDMKNLLNDIDTIKKHEKTVEYYRNKVLNF